MTNKIIWPLRILFFAFFCLSAISKIYPNPDVAIHLFEKEQLISLGIPFCLSTWLSRLLIALEFTLAIGFLLPFYFRRITLPFSIVLMVFFTIYLFYEVFIMGKWTGNCGCFGQLIPMTPPVSLLKNGIALALLGVIFWKRNEIIETKKPSILYYIGAYVGIFLLLYFISPNTCICATKEKVHTELSEEVNLLKDKFPALADGKAILCFYSPTCSHCMNTAKILQSLKGKTGVDTHYVVFMIEGEDTEKKIKKFLLETKLKAKYTTIEFIDFPTDTDPPAILLVNNGKVEKRFFGNDVNKFEKAKFLKAFTSLK
jgi:hypothetical protein